MSAWSFPFDNLSKAKRFIKKMREPWIAKVTYDPDRGCHAWSAKGLNSPFGCEALYGEDDLWVCLNEVAKKQKKDFDIRKYVKEYLSYQLWYFENAIDIKYNLNAMNEIRILLKQKPIDANRKPNRAQKGFLKIKDVIEKNNGEVKNFSQMQVLKVGKKWEPYDKVPSEYKNKTINNAEFFVTTAKNLKPILMKLSFVEKIKLINFSEVNKVFVIFYRNPTASEAAIEQEMPPASYKIKPNELVRMELKNKKSNKFWEAKVKKSELHVQFGRIDHKPRKSVRAFNSKAEALVHLQKLIGEKQKKGYRKIK